MRYILIITVCTLFSSCKKDYTCACTNTNGTYDAGVVNSTKSSAKTYCSGLSAGDTKCVIK